MRALSTLAFLGALTFLPIASLADWTLGSPDGQVTITVKLAPGGRLVYEVSCAGARVLEESPLGIAPGASFNEGLELVEAGAITSHDTTYTLLHGKRRQARDHYNAQVLSFRRAETPMELHLRAYDDGVAFRYRVDFPQKKALFVKEEATGFHLPEGSRIWAQSYDEPTVYTPAYEQFWEFGVPAGTPSPIKAGWAFPLLFRTAEGRWGLLTEAALDGSYCGMRLAAEAPGGLYRVRFPDPFEGNTSGNDLMRGVQPEINTPWASPWRVVMAATSPAPIVESTLVENLNPPTVVADTSWIKPGRVSWSWLFDPDSPQDCTKLKGFVDLAADMGWEYTLVDANWDIMRNGTIHDLIAYANEKGVGVFLWYNSGGSHNAVTERPRGMMDQQRVRRYEFERLAKWGVKGVKIDFFQSDKQNVIRLYHEILRDAADFKIMVNFHGCTLPRGWSRTYPHLMSMEAVRGAENYQFEKKFPAYAPRHNTTLPFTRNVVGPMDYTPTMFRDNVHPLVTTPGHEIALPIVFESGLLHFAGGPQEYRELPEVPKQFLKTIPVTWDETRLLDGEPGRYVVLARRKGDAWYIGGLEGEGQARDLEVRTEALGAGPWTATVIEDGADRTLTGETVTVPAGGSLKRPVRPNGGLAIRLSPAG